MFDLDRIETRDDFLSLLERFEVDTKLAQDIENQKTLDFLEAMARWVRDADGLEFDDTGPLDTNTATWHLFSCMIQAALIYE